MLKLVEKIAIHTDREPNLCGIEQTGNVVSLSAVHKRREREKLTSSTGLVLRSRTVFMWGEDSTPVCSQRPH